MKLRPCLLQNVAPVVLQYNKAYAPTVVTGHVNQWEVAGVFYQCILIHGLLSTTNNVCLPDELANANTHRGVATLLCVAGDSWSPTTDETSCKTIVYRTLINN